MSFLTRLWDIIMGNSLSQDGPMESQETSALILIVGLGNPGSKHEANRHNIGFMAVDRLAEIHYISMGRVQNKSIFGKGTILGHPVILAKPQTYMNRSGDSISQLVRFYKIPVKQVLVVYDELDLPLDSLRLRQKGGAGGHNGMKSVIQHLGNEFPRLRLGIGRPPGKMDPAAFVLRDFRKEELPVVAEVLDSAAMSIESFIVDGVDIAMTKHNKK